MPKYRVAIIMTNGQLAPTSNIIETHAIYESLLPRVRVDFKMDGRIRAFNKLLRKLGTEELVEQHYDIEEI